MSSILIKAHNRPKGGGFLMSKLLGIPYTYRNRKKILIVDTAINWGCSSISDSIQAESIINWPNAVALAVNKITTFKMLHNEGVSTLAYRTTRLGAENLIVLGHKVICRTLINSSKGKGIVLAKTKEDIVDAELYTLFYNKQQELRVHVVNNNTLIQKKKLLSTVSLKSRGIVRSNKFIRNKSNGYILSSNHELNEYDTTSVHNLAISAIQTLGLHFGAVDMLQDSEGVWRVIEVNTAPGLTSSITKEFYQQQLLKYL